MADMTNDFEEGLLALIFTNTTYTGIGDDGLSGSTTAQTLGIALAYADPGEASGDGATAQTDWELQTSGGGGSEFAAYVRQTVARDAGASGWLVSSDGSGNCDNKAAITWSAGVASDDAVVSHVAICKKDVENVDDALFYGNVTSGLTIGDGVIPTIAIGALDAQLA